MNGEIKKVIIPIAGLGTRFLPLSKIVPKEIWPLVDKPVIQYILEEAKNAGLQEVIFVLNTKKNIILEYFKNLESLEKILKQRKREALLQELESIKELAKGLKFWTAYQKKPMGDGHAILQGENFVKNEPFGVLFGDDIVESKTPAILQLMKIFQTSNKPVLALYRIPKERISSYGIVAVEKIANRVFKIKKIVEKPRSEEAPSNLAIVGKYILTPEVLQYLKQAKPNKKGEIVLAETLQKMLDDGKTIYGYELEGKWLECGTKLEWLKTHLYLSLKSERYGDTLKQFIRENKLL